MRASPPRASAGPWGTPIPSTRRASPLPSCERRRSCAPPRQDPRRLPRAPEAGRGPSLAQAEVGRFSTEETHHVRPTRAAVVSGFAAPFYRGARLFGRPRPTDRARRPGQRAPFAPLPTHPDLLHPLRRARDARRLTAPEQARGSARAFALLSATIAYPAAPMTGNISADGRGEGFRASAAVFTDPTGSRRSAT
jgi:hypothetical protein